MWQVLMLLLAYVAHVVIASEVEETVI